MRRYGPTIAGAAAPQPMASPFDEPPCHEHALWAVNDLQERLKNAEEVAPGIRLEALESAKGGTMLGVLVVRDPASSELSYLRAFAGEIAGEVLVPGWAPPLYAQMAYAERREASEATLGVLEAKRSEENPEAARLQIHSRWAKRNTEIQLAIDGLASQRRAARAERKIARLNASQEELQALDHQSRHLNARFRDQKLQGRTELDGLQAQLKRAQRRVGAWRRLRRYLSRTMLARLQETYALTSLHCGEVSLKSVFHPKAPPGGAGDCAGVKLVGWAIDLGLEPVALAEVWWGAPPAGGGRVPGGQYPACRSKCGPILEHMLRGAEVVDATRSGPQAPDPATSLPVLFEDEHLLVINKPPGLLSVPGRKIQDSAQSRLQVRHPELRAVHRLDQDASGVLVLAKTKDALRWAQAEFASRRVYKCYQAVLDGDVSGESGEIRLAFRLDPEQRPRQVYDPINGKHGISRWRVLDRSPGCTTVELEPMTGRTHQLRCHMAHALGLAAPIHGDRLYGRADSRLMLHALRLHLRSPEGRDYRFEAPSLFD